MSSVPFNQRIFVWAVRFSALLSASVVLALFLFLIYFCLPLLHPQALEQLFSWDWKPFQEQFGILPMIAASFVLACSALLLAFPLGVGICCVAHGMGPRRPALLVMRTIQLMTSVPTVVYGFVAVFVLVPLLRNVFHHGSGFSWLAALLGLSVLVLPTVVLMLHSQFQVAEPQVRITAAALGITRAQKLLYLVIPMSRRGFLAAAVLGFGRAFGDTMIPLMLAGNAPQLTGSLLDSLRALTAHIALVVATDSHSLAYQSLFAAGLILLVTSALVNLALRWIQARTVRSERTAPSGRSKRGRS